MTFIPKVSDSSAFELSKVNSLPCFQQENSRNLEELPVYSLYLNCGECS